MGPKPKPPEDRFWPKVEVTGFCWNWTGFRGAHGHGQFKVTPTTSTGAHRWAYEFLVGPIPDGMFLDHLCRNTGCVNPDHLEPVTNAENVMRGFGPAANHARKTHCPKGHPFPPKADGKKRRCGECERIRSKARYDAGTHGHRRHLRSAT